MKKICGWFKAYTCVEVEDNASEEEIKAKIADRASWNYFTTLSPEDIIIESEVERK